MSVVRMDRYILDGDLVTFYDEHHLIDTYISTVRPWVWDIWVVMHTYADLGWDFSPEGALADLLRSNTRLAIIVDSFFLTHLLPLLPLFQQRTVTTHILHPHTGRTGLLTLWSAEVHDIWYMLQAGIAIYEPADFAAASYLLQQAKVQYMRCSSLPIPERLTSHEDEDDDGDVNLAQHDSAYLLQDIMPVFSAPKATPNVVILVSGYLVYEGWILAQQLDEAGSNVQVFCMQELSAPQMDETFLYAVRAAGRVVIMLDQADDGFAKHLAALLPSAWRDEVDIRVLTPQYQGITTHYHESVPFQTVWE